MVRRSTRRTAAASRGVRYSGLGFVFDGFIFPHVVDHTLAPAVHVPPSVPVRYAVLVRRMFPTLCVVRWIGNPRRVLYRLSPHITTPPELDMSK